MKKILSTILLLTMIFTLVAAMGITISAKEGDLLYVASEYARTGFCFPYRTKDTKDWQEHAHGFEGVIEALLEDPENFSIEGFEEYYSRQELEMLMAIQEKLHLDNSKG